MNYQQVFQRFCELSRLSEKEAQQYKWLCNNAADELSEMLVSNIDKTKCGGYGVLQVHYYCGKRRRNQL